MNRPIYVVIQRLTSPVGRPEIGDGRDRPAVTLCQLLKWLRWTHDTAEIVGEAAVATFSRSPARATVVMMRASDTFLERPLAGSPGR